MRGGGGGDLYVLIKMIYTFQPFVYVEPLNGSEDTPGVSTELGDLL